MIVNIDSGPFLLIVNVNFVINGHLMLINLSFGQDSILTTLRSNEVKELSFLDFLVCLSFLRGDSRSCIAFQSYMPLFLGIHGNIVAHPLEMQQKGGG